MTKEFFMFSSVTNAYLTNWFSMNIAKTGIVLKPFGT